jgi:HD-GYP domain-containing protein (c-di-GMP phosphodiesterase class II)
MSPANPNLPKLLFVDSDPGFAQTLLADRKAAIVPPLFAETGASAIELLGDPTIELAALFVSDDVQGPDALSVIRRAKQLRPTLPVTLVYPGEACTIDPHILDKLGCETIHRGFTYGQMARRYFPPEALFEPSDALDKSAHDPAPLGHERDHDPEEFLPIRADSFLSGKKAFFDLYVKLGSGKLLKILKAGDDFTRDRLEHYLSKGVEHFYIHKETQQDYLAYSGKLTAAIVAHPKVQPEVKINHVLAGGESVLAYLRQGKEVDHEQLRFAESYVRLVESLLTELGIDKQTALLASILRNPELREHVLGTTMLAGLIAHQLGFETRKSAAILGVGSLLHDAGLPEGHHEVELIFEEKMTDVQRRAWLEHPLKGAQILGHVSGLSPVVVDIAANHHRRRDGSGFPNGPGLGLNKISVPVEIVGVTDEIVRLFMRNVNAKTEDLHRQIRTEILPFFGADLADAVKIVLHIGDY